MAPAGDTSAPPTVPRRKRGGWFWGMIGSAVLMVAPLIGALGTVVGMLGAFSSLRKTAGADPSELAGDISISLYSTMIGLVLCAIGLPLFILSLVMHLRQGKRRP